MGHHITAIISSLPINEDKAEEYDVFIWKQRGYALLGLDPCHSDFLSEKLNIEQTFNREIILDCKFTHMIAKEVIGSGPNAIIETDYFGGMGEQTAVVYENGKVILELSKGNRGPINKSLSFLGIEKNGKTDEFENFGLNELRDFYPHFEKYKQ